MPLDQTERSPEAEAALRKLTGAGRRGKARAAARKSRKKPGSGREAAQSGTVDGTLRGSDLGSPLQMARGVVEFSAEVHVPDDPDDKRSLTRIAPRAQRVWAPDRLMRGRSPAISAEQYQAAQRYFDDYLIGEMGARRGPIRGGARLGPWNRMPYSEQRAMRRQSWRMATKAVGRSFADILFWCVLQETPSPDIAPTVERWAAVAGCRTERAVGFFVGALEALAQHYGYARKPEPGRIGES